MWLSVRPVDFMIIIIILQLLILRYSHAAGLSSLLTFALTVVPHSLSFLKYLSMISTTESSAENKVSIMSYGSRSPLFLILFLSLENCVRAAQIQQKTGREYTIHRGVVVICAGKRWATFVSVAAFTVKRCEPAFSVFSLYTFHSRQCTYTELKSPFLS
jgi:hypothetical protein